MPDTAGCGQADSTFVAPVVYFYKPIFQEYKDGKNIAVLGSTGSIGVQTLDVARNLEFR